MTMHGIDGHSNPKMRIATATDLSRVEVDRAHREEIEAARAEVETANRMRDLWDAKARELATEISELNSTLDVVTANRDIWREDCEQAQSDRALAENDAAKWFARCDGQAWEDITAERDKWREDCEDGERNLEIAAKAFDHVHNLLQECRAERDRARDLAVRACAFDDRYDAARAVTDLVIATRDALIGNRDAEGYLAARWWRFAVEASRDLDAAVARYQAGLTDQDTVSSPPDGPPATRSAVSGPGTLPTPQGASESLTDECPHEAWVDVPGAVRCADCGDRPSGHRRGYR